METTIKKWGNSLAWRIPKDIVQHLNLFEGKKVKLIIDESSVTLKAAENFTIEDFMEGLSAENRHSEFFKNSVGKERFWEEEEKNLNNE